VEACPGKHQPYRARREIALGYEALDLHDHVVLPVRGVEMGWPMLAVEHCDCDSEETLDLRHGRNMHPCAPHLVIQPTRR